MASERTAEQLRAIIATSLSGRCVLEGRVLHSDDTASDPRVDAEACRRVRAASMLCVPLAHQGETVGVLKVYSPEAHHFGLPNRRDFEERLPVELARASRSSRPVSLCLFDLRRLQGRQRPTRSPRRRRGPPRGGQNSRGLPPGRRLL